MTATSRGDRRSICTVELFGIARVLTGQKRLEVDLADGARLRDLLPEIARLCPALVGPVLRPDLQALVEGHVFNVNGRSFAGDLAVALSPGDTVLLLYSASGG